MAYINQNNNINKSSTNCTSKSKIKLNLESISYADYVILSSTLAYAVTEELSDTDIDMILVFLGLLEADIALIRTRRGIIQGTSASSQNSIGAEAIIGGDLSSSTGDITSQIGTSRGKNRKRKKIKRIKKIKKKKKKINNENLPK